MNAQTTMNIAPTKPWQQRRERLAAACVRGFHLYANWLIGISWRRFILLSVLLMVVSGLLQNIPPFSWTYTTTVRSPVPMVVLDPSDVPATKRGNPPGIHIEAPASKGKAGVDISIDSSGVRIVQQSQASASAASSVVSEPVIDIRLPPGTSEVVRQAVEEARKAIEEAVHEARDEAEAARADAEAARQASRSVTENASRDTARAVAEARRAHHSREVHVLSLGEFLPSLAMLWIVASLIIKISYKRQVQAQAQAAHAVETAESESLKRQVVEARMAAMQAQIEPHFLFNTLASIDHLIEVDPPRASQMQKYLIALLRASMPTLRETDGAAASQARDLARELAVIRPYLEILKVRMEERLVVEIDVPDGLLSAEFPTMMLQTLVENAVKHGLEPQPDGGRLTIKAEIVHGRLAVTVSDSGLGFGLAATAGTGVGLANIRERLQLLYGTKAGLTIGENPGGGTRVTLSLPYKPVGNDPARL